MSPPFGYSMFYLKAVSPADVTMADLYRAVAPFIGLQLIALALCMAFPQIILWIPGTMIR
jgi:TRAP-type mannitol/chloroaromatic compound transport system permease large subunit